MDSYRTIILCHRLLQGKCAFMIEGFCSRDEFGPLQLLIWKQAVLAANSRGILLHSFLPSVVVLNKKEKTPQVSYDSNDFLILGSKDSGFGASVFFDLTFMKKVISNPEWKHGPAHEMPNTAKEMFSFSLLFPPTTAPPFKGVICHWLYFTVSFNYERDLSILKWRKIFHWNKLYGHLSTFLFVWVQF